MKERNSRTGREELSDRTFLRGVRNLGFINSGSSTVMTGYSLFSENEIQAIITATFAIGSFILATKVDNQLERMNQENRENISSEV